MSAPLMNEFSYRPGQGQPFGPYRLDSLFLYAEIDTTGGTTFNLYELPKKQSEIAAGTKTQGGVIDVSVDGNFSVVSAAVRVTGDLTATTGDKFRLGTGVTDATGPSFTASGSKVAAGLARADAAWGANLSDHTSDATFKLYSVTSGTPDVAGHTVAAASGSVLVIVRLDLAFRGQGRVPEAVDVLRRAVDE